MLSNRLRERVSFMIMYYIAYNFYHNKEPWTLHDLVDHMKLPVDPVHESLLLLENNSLLLETGDDPPAYLPSRDLSTITLQDLFQVIRMADAETRTIETQMTTIPEVDRVIETLDNAAIDALSEKTLQDIVK